MLGHACPRGCGGRGANVIFPPGSAPVPVAPSHAHCGSSSSAPTGLQATETGSFPRTPVAWCLQPSGLAHPHASVHPRLRTLGSCPCAPCPDHHPGSAGPGEKLKVAGLAGHLTVKGKQGREGEAEAPQQSRTHQKGKEQSSCRKEVPDIMVIKEAQQDA